MGSTTGYIREKMVRSLRHVELSEIQKNRLTETFMQLLRAHNLKMDTENIFVSLGKLVSWGTKKS
jgi:hypothetical protein